MTLNRPDALNALNDQMKAELADVWRELANRRDARSVLLTGAGRAFSTGGDIKQMDPERGLETTRLRMTKLLREVVIPLYRLDKPVVAAVNGHAHGLGLAIGTGLRHRLRVRRRDACRWPSCASAWRPTVAHRSCCLGWSASTEPRS